MIKFFRKIRQRLVSESKFSKYLIYGIGEIILVVIGILIALQINNMNEARKTEIFEGKILEDILISMDGNFFQLDLCLNSNRKSLASANLILSHFENNLEYNDSLNYHFSKSLEWCNPVLTNSGYESLKTYGRNLITNDTIREKLGIYDAGWMEGLAQRQEDFFYNSANPALLELFDKVAMRTEMTPLDFDALKQSKVYLNILKTSIAYREDQVFWHEEWKESLQVLYGLIEHELNDN